MKKYIIVLLSFLLLLGCTSKPALKDGIKVNMAFRTS